MPLPPGGEETDNGMEQASPRRPCGLGDVGLGASSSPLSPVPLTIGSPLLIFYPKAAPQTYDFTGL